MKLPSNWNEITLEQYNEIKDAPERNAGVFSLGAWVLAVLLDEEVEEIEDKFTAVEIAQAFNRVKWILSEPKGKLKEEINLNGISLKLKPVNKCTFGEAIDTFSAMAKDQVIERVASIYFRRWKVDEWEQIVYEPRGYDLEERIEQMQSLYVGEICEVINEFKKYNSTIRENYSELFDDNEDDEEEREPWEEDDEENDETERESYEEKKEKARKEAQKKHGWHLIALKLVNNDATRINDAYKLPFSYVMNILAIEHETRG